MRRPKRVNHESRAKGPGPRGGALPALPLRVRAARGRTRGDDWGEVHRTVLPNGLRVLTARAPGLHSAMIALYVRAGSRHETGARNGVSHFLEHLFFRGSVGFPDTVAMNAAVEAAGGGLNGITARDHGCYYTPIHPHQVGTGLHQRAHRGLAHGRHAVGD